jgi:hypothetical protein
LAEAFIVYRTAQVLLGRTASVLDEVSGLGRSLDEEALRVLDYCEEMRVLIGNSFLTAALDRPNSPNITLPWRWEEWLSELATTPMREALNEVDDRYLRLLFPEPFRMAAEMCVRLDHAPHDRKTLATAIRSAKGLSFDVPRPVRPFPASSLTMRIYRGLRAEEPIEAAEWWRASGEYTATLARWLDIPPPQE